MTDGDRHEKDGTIQAQIVLVERQGKSDVVIVLTTTCPDCGTQTLVVPAHHAQAVALMLETAIEHLPPQGVDLGHTGGAGGGRVQ